MAYIRWLKSDEGNKFFSIPAQIKLCNFGSSHGENGFYYGEDQYESFNFALSAQYLSYDLRLLKNYREHLEEQGVALIVISHQSFFGVDEIKTSQFESKNRRYYDILPKELIKEYSARTAFYLKNFPAFAGNYTLLLALAGSLWNKPATGRQNGNDTMCTVDWAAEAEDRYTSHIIEQKYDMNGDRIYNQEEIDAVYEMIAICREIGVTPVLITTPFAKEYTDLIHERKPDFYNDFYGLIDRVCNETGVEYFDYSEDGRFNKDHSLFADADHLNENGAKMFTAIVMEEVVDPLFKKISSV